MSSSTPVFVRGLSRSGGTLLCTILDAHPELAISYELYPNLLKLDDGYCDSVLHDFLDNLKTCRAIKRMPPDVYPTKRYRTFFIRLERGGISKREAETLLAQALDSQLRFDTPAGRCAFVEMCCLLKMKKENKTHWGAKMNNQIEQYLRCWPGARCIDIVRDGRDVAASQLQLGTFGKTVDQIASSWKNTHKRFLDFEKSHPNNVKVIKYEDLISDSENQIREMCTFLGIEYSDRMMNYHKEKLTLFDANHISKNKVMNGINSGSVGKWKDILSENQIEQFNDIAYELIEYFNY